MKDALALALILGIASSVSAQQASYCDVISHLERSQKIQIVTLPSTDRPAHCQPSLVLGEGSQLHCSWAFDYRAQAALDGFQNLVSTLENCLGPETEVTLDQDVNHPDFYDLRTFKNADQEISASLKDKGALQRTYVFLRISQVD